MMRMVSIAATVAGSPFFQHVIADLQSAVVAPTFQGAIMLPPRCGYVLDVNTQALVEVRRAVAPLGIPVAAGERLFTRHLYLDLFRERAVDIIQPDICHVGGIAEMRKIAAIAEAYYMPLAPHNACSPVGTMASLHVAVATPNFKILETFDDMVEPWVREAIVGRPEIINGHLLCPQQRSRRRSQRRSHLCPPAAGRLYGLLEEGLGKT